MIAIIDYGAGNLQSVKKAFDYLAVTSKIVTTSAELDDVDKIVLPGVGAFGAAVDRLQQTGFYQKIKIWLKNDRPFLGICLGMQLLLESSTESKGYHGFGLFQGQCLRFDMGKVPQIGWNQVDIEKHCRLLTGINSGTFFYFLHGYYVAPLDDSAVIARTGYGITYPSILKQGNVYAVQFHPEKSGKMGLQLLENWVTLC